MRTVFSLVIVLFFVSILNPTTSDAQDSPVYMYWANLGMNKIQRANLDGTNVQDIVTGISRPVGITLDMSVGKLYWTDRDKLDFTDPNGRNRILRANLDGTNIETLISGGPSVKEAIALDLSGGKMYWADWGGFSGANKIQRANLDGTNVQDLITVPVEGVDPGLEGPRGIALDLSRGKMYWTDCGAGKVQQANLDGSNVEDIVTGLHCPTYVALDVSVRKIYWGDWTSGKIQRVNFDGSNLEDLVSGLGNPAGIALDVSGGKVYWTDAGTNKIQRANLDGTNVEDLVTGVGPSIGIALGIPQVQPGDGIRFSPNTIADQTFTVGTYASLNLPVATGGSEPYTYTLTPNPPAGLLFDAPDRWLGGTPTTPMPATSYTYTATDAAGQTASLTFTITVRGAGTPPGETDVMYLAIWSTPGNGEIRRINLDGTNLQTLVTGLTWARDVALDIDQNKMYWVDARTRKVQRANLDGTNVEDLVNTHGQPFGVAVDTTHRKMYWSTWGPGKIRRANLDGTNIEDFVTGLSEPEDIDLDISGGKIYWTDTVTNKIQRANLDGSNVEDLVTAGLSHPLGMALDVVGRKMYWTNTSFWPGPWPGLDKIQRANLDGSNVEDLVTTGVVTAHGIALDVSIDKMYWANGDGIKRANLDGSNVEYVTTETTGLGIALGIPQRPPDGGLRFSPNMIADQTFTVGTDVSLTLPTATGGTPPYTYSLAPSLPAGLYFDPIADGPGYIGGTPTTVMQPTDFTYTATDTTSTSAALTFTIEVIEDGTGPGGDPLDVNRDGQVNVVDLAIVALFYGMRVPVGVSLPADVNADGIVNLLDLTAVAQGIDATDGVNGFSLQELEAALLAGEIEVVAGAPTGFGKHQHTVSLSIRYSNVAAALADVRQMTVGDIRLGKEIAVLEGLLRLLAEMGAIPEATALLPNYPNPFNPETWIPYHLATDAEVVLTVYDVRGSMVRELRFGHQPAGVYESRGRAAYWDGKNQLGEKVTSGLYFYTLTAGEFTATRKMLIRK